MSSMVINSKNPKSPYSLTEITSDFTLMSKKVWTSSKVKKQGIEAPIQTPNLNSPWVGEDIITMISFIPVETKGKARSSTSHCKT